MSFGFSNPRKPKQALRISYKASLQAQTSMDEVIYDALHENAMRDAMVLFYNKPLLAMQWEKGILPKRAKTLEALYKALLKNAFEDKRSKLSLPKSSTKHAIAKAVAQHLN